MTLKLKNIFPFCFLFLVFTGCTNYSPPPELASDSNLLDGDLYISNPDSKAFLKDWSKENVVVFHTTSQPDDLHPTNGNSSGRAFINNYTQLKLVASDIMNLSIRPDLVKTLPEISKDELHFTYELRTEPTWDNGAQVSVEDVLFTFKANVCALTNNPAAKSYLENMKDIVSDPANQRKFSIVMKKRYIQNMVFLTEIPILQRSYFDTKNLLGNYSFKELSDSSFKADAHEDIKAWANEFNDAKYGHNPENLVGLGPYQVTNWENGQSITLTKKKNHWTSKLKVRSAYEEAYPEKIIFRMNQDENSEILEFKNQSLDASTWLATKTLLTLQEDSNFTEIIFLALPIRLIIPTWALIPSLTG